jgi:hypothetical protein
MERLPLRLDERLARRLGCTTADLHVQADAAGSRPSIRCILPRPAREAASFVLRVHSRAGIPLAMAPVSMNFGEQEAAAGQLTILAMEGYAHLAEPERLAVEQRVWSRRAFAVASAG